MRGDFYHQHLSRVSRSFAFCIEQMPNPEREWIGLSYILCRLIDTVEDSAWASQKAQEAAFETFIRFIGRVRESNGNHLDRGEVQRWVETFPSEIPEGERLLVNDAHVFLNDLSRLKEGVRHNICDRVSDMSRGMLHFTRVFRESGELRLKTVEQANQYCFFVAGVVGELLTTIMNERIPELGDDREALLNSYHFGFYLQKVNLLKDHFGDALQGRFFVPDFVKIRASVDQHSIHALDYLLAIPESAREYRLFCGWSLFLGLASLKWIDFSWRAKKFKKIPRLEALSILNRVERKIGSNADLRIEFQSFVPDVATETAKKRVTDTHSSINNQYWFTKIYSGRLSLGGMNELGMLENIDGRSANV